MYIYGTHLYPNVLHLNATIIIKLGRQYGSDGNYTVDQRGPEASVNGISNIGLEVTTKSNPISISLTP